MTTTSPKNTTIAFFGATGECAGHCLALALQAGYTCIALARTPSKLTSSLEAKTVPSTALDQHLTIIQGNAKDSTAVRKTLISPISGRMVTHIVSGIGGPPKLQASLWCPVTLDDPTICQDVGAVLLSAARTVANETKTPASQRPFFINVSTTGIPAPACPRDVPLLFYPLYVWCLHVPHEDKRVLQQKLAAHVTEEESGISGFLNVKPSLLMDGEAVGLEKVREGTQERPALGYTIRRKDVGAWMFRNAVEESVKREYFNKSVTITY